MKWVVKEWGWVMEANERWLAQVYREPWEWRVFYLGDVVASGHTDTANVARRRGKAVLVALKGGA